MPNFLDSPKWYDKNGTSKESSAVYKYSNSLTNVKAGDNLGGKTLYFNTSVVLQNNHTEEVFIRLSDGNYIGTRYTNGNVGYGILDSSNNYVVRFWDYHSVGIENGWLVSSFSFPNGNYTVIEKKDITEVNLDFYQNTYFSSDYSDYVNVDCEYLYNNKQSKREIIQFKVSNTSRINRYLDPKYSYTIHLTNSYADTNNYSAFLGRSDEDNDTQIVSYATFSTINSNSYGWYTNGITFNNNQEVVPISNIGNGSGDRYFNISNKVGTTVVTILRNKI